MKMPNKHSAPRGRQTLRDDIEIHAAGGFFSNLFGGNADPAAGMYQRARDSQRQARGQAQNQRFSAGVAATMAAQQAETARRNEVAAQPRYENMQGEFSESQAQPVMATPAGTGNMLRQDRVAAPAPNYAAPAAGARSAMNPGLAAPAPAPTANMQANFLARNPGVAANRIASPGAPPAPAPVPGVSPLPAGGVSQAGMPSGVLRSSSNSFGDAASVWSGANPANNTPANNAALQAAWAKPGRSTGQPIDQTPAAGGPVMRGPEISTNPGGMFGRPVDPRPDFNPLGEPNRGVKAPQSGGGSAGSFTGFGMKNGGQLRLEDGGMPMSDLERRNLETSASSIVHDGSWAAATALLNKAGPRTDMSALDRQNAMVSASSIIHDGNWANANRNLGIESPMQTGNQPYGIGTPGDPHAGGGLFRPRRPRPALMNNGGTLRTGHGGEVPGTGSGDKIPAKYEPGEFVVSNDMLDADPSLQTHLSALREHVLAQKGMTPAQADRKALNGGKGLRAENAAHFPRIEYGAIPGAAGQIPLVEEAKQYAQSAGANPNGVAEDVFPKDSSTSSSPKDAKPTEPKFDKNGNRLYDKITPAAKSLEADALRKATGSQTPQTGVPLAERQAGWAAQDAAAPTKPQTLAERINARNALSESRIAQKIGGVQQVGEAIRGRLRAAGNVIEAVGNNPYVKVGAAAYGGYQATQEGGKTLDALDQGDGAGALRHGALTAANAAQVAPLLGRAALGAAGTGYAVGDWVGSKMNERADEGKSTLGYDAGTKHSLGRSINSLMRTLGGGVNDDALRAMENQPKFDGGATRAPAAQPAAAQPSLEEKNAAMLRSGGFNAAEANAPGEIGQERNFDREGNMLGEGLAQVWTGPKMGWQTQTSAAGKQANALREAQREAKYARDADLAANGPTSFRAQLRNMQEMNAATRESQLANGEITDPRARAAIEAGAGRRSKLREQEIQSDGQIRSAEIQAGGTRRAAEITAQSNAQKNQLDLMRFQLDEKKYGTETANQRRDDRRSSMEAFDKRVLGMAGTTPDGKPNEQAASQLRVLANAFLSQKQAKAEELLKQNPNHQGALAVLAAIEKDGPGAIDEETMRKIMVNSTAQQVAQEYDGWKINPWAGKAKDTTAPIGKLRLQDNFLMPNQYTTENGQLIPQRAVERNPDLQELVVR